MTDNNIISMYYNYGGKPELHPYYNPEDKKKLEKRCDNRGHLIIHNKISLRKTTRICLRCGEKITIGKHPLPNTINIKTDTKNRLKELFPHDSYNKILEKLIWANYCLKFLLIQKPTDPFQIIDIEYIRNYEKTNSKFTTIKIDDNVRDYLDLFCAALYKISPIISWSGKPRVYVRNIRLGEMVYDQKNYNEMINELIDNYIPKFLSTYNDNNYSYMTTVRLMVNNRNYPLGLETTQQHYKRILKADRMKNIYEGNRIAWGLDDIDDEDDDTRWDDDSEEFKQLEMELFLHPKECEN